MDDYLDDPFVYMYNTDDYQYTTTDPGYSVLGADDPAGFQTIRYDDGSTLIVDNQGNPIGSTPSTDSGSPGFAQTLSNLVSRGGQAAFNAIKSAFTKPDGSIDWRAVATTAGGIGGLLNIGGAQQKPTGYQGKIPEYTAVRQAVQPQYDPNRRPGSSGMRYFTDVQYTAPANVSAAQTAAAEQAQGLAALNAQNPARQSAQQAPTLAKGGIVNLQPGGFVLPADVVSHVGNGSSGAGMRTLQSRLGAQPILGRGDGMSDSNRTTIAGRQPAAVAHEEMYLEPRQVQELGGPERLYSMMDNIRKARTGTTKQGRQINPDQFLPRQA